jgi:hypothetical protein
MPIKQLSLLVFCKAEPVIVNGHEAAFDRIGGMPIIHFFVLRKTFRRGGRRDVSFR